MIQNIPQQSHSIHFQGHPAPLRPLAQPAQINWKGLPLQAPPAQAQAQSPPAGFRPQLIAPQP